MWLGRTDPEIDAEKHPFQIQEKKRTGGMTLAAGNTLPCEYAGMEWRVDLYRSSVVDAARL